MVKYCLSIGVIFLESGGGLVIILTRDVRLWYPGSRFAARSMPKHPLSQLVEQGQFFHVYILSAEDRESLASELEIVVDDIKVLNGHNSLDIHRLIPEDGTIDVESVKSFRQLFSRQAVSKVRLGIIEHVDTMTIPAQQMLLKLLEEAPPKSMFLLTTSRLKSISKPILSRTAIYRIAAKPHIVSEKYQAWFTQLFDPQQLLIDKQQLIDEIDKESSWSELSYELSHYLHHSHASTVTIQKWLFTLSLGQQSTKIKTFLEYFFLT